jgi:5'(3')-deoxyribonucleotidase
MTEPDHPIERPFILGVDLDGVCADFYNGIRPLAAEWLGVDEKTLPRDVSYGLREWGIDAGPGGYLDFHKFAVTQRHLFQNLQPISGCPQILRRLSKQGIRIRIITHRLFIKYFHKQAVAQTIDWLEYHGIPYWDLCLMQHKTDVGAHLYIEDSPHNVLDLREAGQEVIVFTNSTNRHIASPRANSWTEVEPLVMQCLQRWRTDHAPRPPREPALQ